MIQNLSSAKTLFHGFGRDACRQFVLKPDRRIAGLTPVSLALAKSNTIFRTVDSEAGRDSVRRLASIARIIVLDTRQISPNVTWEAGLVLCLEFARKTICIFDDLGGLLLLDSMSLDQSAVTTLGAVVATQDEVLQKIKPSVIHWIRSGMRRVPDAGPKV